MTDKDLIFKKFFDKYNKNIKEKAINSITPTRLPSLNYWEELFKSKNHKLINFNLQEILTKTNFKSLKKEAQYLFFQKALSHLNLENIILLEKKLGLDHFKNINDYFYKKRFSQLQIISRSNGTNPFEQAPFFNVLFNPDSRVFFYLIDKYQYPFDQRVVDYTDFGDTFYFFLFGSFGINYYTDEQEKYHKLFNNKNKLFLAKYEYMLSLPEIIQYVSNGNSKSSMNNFSCSPLPEAINLNFKQFKLLAEKINLENYSTNPLEFLAKYDSKVKEEVFIEKINFIIDLSI